MDCSTLFLCVCYCCVGLSWSVFVCLVVVFFFCKQKTAYEMRISDWSSDVCSSDLFLEMRRTGRRAMHDEAEARQVVALANLLRKLEQQREHRRNDEQKIGRASCRARVCQYV